MTFAKTLAPFFVDMLCFACLVRTYVHFEQSKMEWKRERGKERNGREKEKKERKRERDLQIYAFQRKNVVANKKRGEKRKVHNWIVVRKLDFAAAVDFSSLLNSRSFSNSSSLKMDRNLMNFMKREKAAFEDKTHRRTVVRTTLDIITSRLFTVWEKAVKSELGFSVSLLSVLLSLFLSLFLFLSFFLSFSLSPIFYFLIFFLSLFFYSQSTPHS